MYSDVKPCRVCGSPVELRAAEAPQPPTDQPVGSESGYVGAGDDPVDERVCTNPDCPTQVQ